MQQTCLQKFCESCKFLNVIGIENNRLRNEKKKLSIVYLLYN